MTYLSLAAAIFEFAGLVVRLWIAKSSLLRAASVQRALPLPLILLVLAGCAADPGIERAGGHPVATYTASSGLVPLAFGSQSLPEMPPVSQTDAIAAFSTPILPSALVEDPLPPKDLWDRMRRGFKLPPLAHPLVEAHESRLRSARYFEMRVERLRLYLPLVVAEVERRGLPMELALLPLVESALNCHAASAAAAVGCWQFLDGTARDMSLRISSPDLLLPIEAAERLSPALAAHQGPMASWKPVQTQGHATVLQLALLHRTSEQTLRQANAIPVGQKPGPGSTLLVPGGALSDLHQRVDEQLIASARQHLLPEVVRLWLHARRRDTLTLIAKRIDISLASLIRWNPQVPPARSIKMGTQVMVMIAPEEQDQVLRRATSRTRVAASARARSQESSKSPVAAAATSKRPGLQRS